MQQQKYIYLEEVGSTNDFLMQYDGSEEMVVAWTDFQHAGRGQGTNHWESERGKNLTFSILIHPDNVLAQEQYILSMAIATTLRRYLAESMGMEVSIKWPNDIYVGDRKICGILIENRIAGNHIRDCVIGIGLNVNQKEFLSDAPNPVSMVQLTGNELDRDCVLHGITDLFALQLDTFSRDEIREEYRRNLYRRNGFHTYSDTNGTFSAELITVEDDGHLVLRDSAGTIRTYAFKEVRFDVGC